MSDLDDKRVYIVYLPYNGIECYKNIFADTKRKETLMLKGIY